MSNCSYVYIITFFRIVNIKNTLFGFVFPLYAISTIYGVFDLKCRLLSLSSFLTFYYSQLWGHSQSPKQKLYIFARGI